MDRQTDKQTDGWRDGQAQTNMPPQLLRSWGHNEQKYVVVFDRNYSNNVAPDEMLRNVEPDLSLTLFASNLFSL